MFMFFNAVSVCTQYFSVTSAVAVNAIVMLFVLDCEKAEDSPAAISSVNAVGLVYVTVAALLPLLYTVHDGAHASLTEIVVPVTVFVGLILCSCSSIVSALLFMSPISIESSSPGFFSFKKFVFVKIVLPLSI